ncbi:MAG: PAS domain-containing protein, partial [Euryarchaeota archaeon]|nr:PAS domain-containing protein [Euryarchaeota archaeon]
MMKDKEKSKEQLIEEIKKLNSEISELKGLMDSKKSERPSISTTFPETELILHSVSDLMIYMDTDLKVIWANKAAYDSLGLSDDDTEKLQGNYCYKLWRDSEEPCKGCPVAKSLQTGQKEELEVKAPSGRIWYVKGFPVHNKNGEIIGVVEIAQEFTERRMMEKALKDSEEKLKNIVYGTPIPTFVINENHQVIYWNRALEEQTNIKTSDVLGTRNHWKAFYSNERPCMADFIVDRDLEDIPKFYAGKYKRSNLVEEAYEASDFFPSLGKNGKWLHFTAAPIKDAKGNIIGAVETLENITEQIVAEESLRKSEKQYRDLVKSALVGIYKTNVDGDILFANNAAAEMFEYDSAENMMQDTILSRFKNLDEHRTAIDKLQKEGKLKDYEYELLTKSGKTIIVLLSATIDGDIISVMTRDITAEKKAEEDLKKALAEKEILLKEIHHRVKNNLMIISSLLNLQSQYIEDEETLEVFKKSQTRAQSMALIHEKLYGSDDLKSINFSEYIQKLASDIFKTYLSDNSNIKLNLQVEDHDLDINTTIPLGLIVNELISNCIKYAFPDGKKGEINVEFLLRDGTFVLEVGDNGVGFPNGLDFRETKS